VHQFSVGCSNDWLAISTMAASTTLEQLVHHGHSSNAFRGWVPRDCRTGVVLPFAEGFCCEVLFGTWLYRAGLRRRRVDLRFTLTKYMSKLLSWRSYMNHSDSNSSTGPLVLDPRAPDTNFDEEVLATAEGWLTAQNQASSEIVCKTLPALAHFGATHVMEPYYASRNERKELPHTVTCTDSRPWPECNKSQGEVKTMFQRPAADCAIQRVPACTSSVNLLRPLPACARRTLVDTVTDVTGYGAPFPWWRWCDGSCEPMPNVSLIFDEEAGLEQAILFPHAGHARKASDEPVGGVTFQSG